MSPRLPTWPLIALLLPALLLGACSGESARRTGYETVESMRIRQCLDRRDDPDCPTERQPYERYESQRPPGASE